MRMLMLPNEILPSLTVGKFIARSKNNMLSGRGPTSIRTHLTLTVTRSATQASCVCKLACAYKGIAEFLQTVTVRLTPMRMYKKGLINYGRACWKQNQLLPDRGPADDPLFFKDA